MSNEFEQVGWNHIDISVAAQQRVEIALRSAGAASGGVRTADSRFAEEPAFRATDDDSREKLYARLEA